MLKTIAATVACTAALATIAITPAVASSKLIDETSLFAPSQGVDVVERKGHFAIRIGFGHRGHGFHHFGHKFGGYGYTPCYWGWKHKKKVWICY